MNEEIFQDKIKLSAVITDKELTLISSFNYLTYHLRLRPDLLKDIEFYPTFYDTWRHLAEIYDFLKNDYLNKLGKFDLVGISAIMEKYYNLESVDYSDLKKAKEIVLKIMSLSGFHTLLRNEEIAGLEKIRQRYKLGKRKQESDN